MKLKNYKEKETLRERGTKKYRERIAEEKEAEEEIKQYDLFEDYVDDNKPAIQEHIWRDNFQ